MSLEYNLMFAIGSRVLCIVENARGDDYCDYITNFSMSVHLQKENQPCHCSEPKYFKSTNTYNI